MAKIQIHADNHYVPKLYLKQWSTDGKIPTYRLLVQHAKMPLWKEHSLKSIAFHEHLYTYLSGQELTDEFEQWMDREFEQPAEEAIRLVVEEGRMSPAHWKLLERFALAQDVRTPARLRAFIKRQHKTLPKLLDDTLARTTDRLERLAELNELPASVPTTLDTSNYLPIRLSIEKQSDGSGQIAAEVTIGRRMWIWQMKHLLTETIKNLPQYRWTVLHAPNGMTWPTSDNPLIRLNFHSSEQYHFEGGWGQKNGDIILPLSPKHILFTSIGNKIAPRGTRVDIPLYQQIKKMIIEHADRYIFSQEPFDIESIRPRLVCAKTYHEEKAAWMRWGEEQSAAEEKDNRTLQRLYPPIVQS